MSYTAHMLGPDGFGVYEVAWDAGPEFRRVSKPANVWLIPGFVDIHLHGAFGIDLMSAAPADLTVLCEKLAALGYEGFLPTTVTASAQAVRHALAMLPDHPMILGFHLEGPFISPQFPGAQPPESILQPPSGPSDWDEILDDPRLKVITLAPELPHATELISRLSNRGVVVSMGHTNATFDEARIGFEFGARHTTHTFNAMRPLHHREAGMVGYALANDSISCELIYDRKHVCKDSAGLLLKIKGKDRVIAISDSSMATGMPPGTVFEMWGHKVETGKKSVTLEGTSTFAGSAVTLKDVFQNLWDDFGEDIAIRLCSLNPRRALGITGMPRVYCEFDKHKELVGFRRLAT
jgi:N-acetylglucosamine-6-phosphate deacetylase